VRPVSGRPYQGTRRAKKVSGESIKRGGKGCGNIPPLGYGKKLFRGEETYRVGKGKRRKTVLESDHTLSAQPYR